MSEQINQKLLNLQKNNCKKYFLLSILLNPALIAFVWTFFWSLTLGPWYIIWAPNVFSLLIIVLTTVLIFLTIRIIRQLFRLNKENLIWKKCFIIIFILWLLPFVWALLFSWACTIITAWGLF